MNTTTAGTESANELKEGVHYYIFKDGYNVEHKIANHKHPIFCTKTSGEIELKAFRVEKNFNKEDDRPDIETKTSFKCVKDRITGLWFGEPIGVDPQDKQIRWKKYPLRMVNTLKMEVLSQRHEWAMISRSSIVEGSPNQSQRPLYKVIDSESENINFMQTIAIRDSAATIIKGMSGNQLIDFAPSIGFHPGAYSPDALRTEFFRYIEKNSKKFMEIWNNPAREVLVQFKKAFQLGVVIRKTDPSTGQFLGFYYDEFPMGISESEAIAWLSQVKNSAYLSSMFLRTQEKENSIHRGNTKVLETKDTEKESLTNEIARLKAELEKAKSIVPINIVNDTVVTNSSEPSGTDVAYSVDSSLEDLHLRAKELGVKGWKLTKDKQVLVNKINEKSLQNA